MSINSPEITTPNGGAGSTFRIRDGVYLTAAFTVMRALTPKSIHHLPLHTEGHKNAAAISYPLNVPPIFAAAVMIAFEIAFKSSSV